MLYAVARGTGSWAAGKAGALRLALTACCAVLASALGWEVAAASEANSREGMSRVGNTVTLTSLLAVLAAELAVAVRVSIRRARKRLSREEQRDSAPRPRPRFRHTPPDPDTFDERLMRALAAARGEWRGWEATELEEQRREAARRARNRRRRAADRRVVSAVRETERRWLREAHRWRRRRGAEVWETHCYRRGAGTVIGITRTFVADGEGGRERLSGCFRPGNPTGVPGAVRDWTRDSEMSAFEDWSDADPSGAAACERGAAEACGVGKRGDEVAGLVGAVSVHQQGWSSEDDPGAWLVG